ncbi:MAG: BREX-1 system adenine-specific DNA-methyltransferase PglX, partial [Clostridia bacterium]|nr:BREX-1 system adenine-specific DNA-methyltransferase PglX [Clostridia bacterium]
IAQCNALHAVLPAMFEEISDYTELLFPSNLLLKTGVLAEMVESIPEEDWLDQVQVIGWLYQFYNSEFKDQTYAELKKNVKLTKEKIPAVTQLFTPDWIVRYMVENSLGRLWYEGHPDATMKSAWKYYLDEAEQEAEVQKQLDEIRAEYAGIKPEEIKIIDPSMGSGHVLVYAFDILMQIYLSQGWNERDAAKSIVENNLYGIDIDERAYQLAYFAVMMKARSYSRRILTQNVKCNLCTIEESNGFDDNCLSLFGKNSGIAKRLVEEFIDAKEYGSILIIQTPLAHLKMLEKQLQEIEATDYSEMDSLIYKEDLKVMFQPLLKQAIMLAGKYDVVVTNPPYMSPTPKQKPYVEKNYPDSKSDLFAVFIEKCQEITANNRFYSMITMQSWMFLSSFEKLRYKLMQCDTVNMAHLGARAFDEIGGEVVQTTIFSRRLSSVDNYKGTYCRLIEPKSEQGKCDMFLAKENKFYAKQDNFKKIPGLPIAYWINPRWFTCFAKYPNIREICVLKKGTSTGDNNRFIRKWYEVDVLQACFNSKCPQEAVLSGKKWFPINGGGENRKWYGNRTDIVNWKNDGEEMKALATKLNNGGHWSRYIVSPDRFFTEAIGWSAISSSRISARYVGYGFAFSSAAMEAFEFNLKYLLAVINSNVAYDILKLLAPTINFGVEQIGKIPLIEQSNDSVECITNECIEISREDWDSFETSWDFKKHPLV